MSDRGTKEFWLAALHADAAAFRAAAGEAVADDGLAAPCPTCPEWTVLDLIHHLGGLYRYVSVHCTRGVTSAPEPEMQRLKTDNLPAVDTLLAWWDEQYAAVRTALLALDPQLPAWNWAPRPKIGQFWYRRMAHETAIHRWDLQMARGRSEPIEARLAVDGVSEVLDTWLPAGRRKGPLDKHGVVQLVATDHEHEWFVRLRGEATAVLDTATLLDDSDHHAKAVAQGTASDVELALYGRVGFDVLGISGDESLLEALRTG